MKLANPLLHHELVFSSERERERKKERKKERIQSDDRDRK